MTLGFKDGAWSFVVTTTGTKMYLSNTMCNLEEQMRSRETTIEVKPASFLYHSHMVYVLSKKNIESYGSVP